MTLLSRKTDYALLILSYLHTHPEGGCARTIAESFGISRAFIANILKELCQKGFVTSHRGVNGGYVLQRAADDITLAELLESLEDGFRVANCNNHSHGEAEGESEEECVVSNICPIRGPIGELHRRILDMLRAVTIAELFQSALPTTTFQPILSTLNLRETYTSGVETLVPAN
ncbi:MAG: Rrf2 family transcriptional regulator [Planctomycetes bacterium]|nr:Rrf2 family transcriptional regulator [Planctomycetota bacterium]